MFWFHATTMSAKIKKVSENDSNDVSESDLDNELAKLKDQTVYLDETGHLINDPFEHHKKTVEHDNPFLKLSDEVLENFAPKSVDTGAKTWRHRLKNQFESAKKSKKSNKSKLSHLSDAEIEKNFRNEIFLQDFLNALVRPVAESIDPNDNAHILNGDFPTRLKDEVINKPNNIVYRPVSTKQVESL